MDHVVWRETNQMHLNKCKGTVGLKEESLYTTSLVNPARDHGECSPEEVLTTLIAEG